MSNKGQDVPEFGEKLREIAQRILRGEVERADAVTLRRLAEMFEGRGQNGLAPRLHMPANRPRLGSEGVDRKLAWAEAIKAHHDEHRCSYDETFNALALKRGFPAAGTLKAAWKEMRSIYRMGPLGRDIWLFFKWLEADRPGSVVTVRRGKKVS